MPFLPVTKEEINALGRSEPDFVLVTGDAYCDHPSFGTAIIGRVLEAAGYCVAILAQHNWGIYQNSSITQTYAETLTDL